MDGGYIQTQLRVLQKMGAMICFAAFHFDQTESVDVSIISKQYWLRLANESAAGRFREIRSQGQFRYRILANCVSVAYFHRGVFAYETVLGKYVERSFLHAFRRISSKVECKKSVVSTKFHIQIYSDRFGLNDNVETTAEVKK